MHTDNQMTDQIPRNIEDSTKWRKEMDEKFGWNTDRQQPILVYPGQPNTPHNLVRNNTGYLSQERMADILNITVLEVARIQKDNQ